MKNKRRVGCAALSVWLLVFPSGCEQVPSQHHVDSLQDKSNAPNSDPIIRQVTYDFGEVSIREGSKRVEHAFTITNDTETSLNIIDVKRSCGCLEAAIDDAQLAPGRSTKLRVALEVKSAGQITQGATVVLSNDMMIMYSLSAHGVVGVELIPILRAAAPDDQNIVNLDAYLIDSHGDGETRTPEVVAPQGIMLSSEGWTTLERHSSLALRPTRQIAACTLNLTEFQGSFPVTVQLKVPLGATCSFVVHGK